MNVSVITVGSDQGEPFRLVWTNDQTGSFHFLPSELTVTLDVARWRREHPDLDAVELSIPPTWIGDRPTWRPAGATLQTLSWRLMPRESPGSFGIPLRATGFARGQAVVTAELRLAIEILGRSQFDPMQHGILTPNRVEDWGIVEPARDLFERTYGFTLFRSRLFRGLYRSIVFLGAQEGRYQGGICTGMARVALERSLSPDAPTPILDQILLWHGRQLCDRALLASASWLFFPSPKRAFEVIRREILRNGTVTRCFDIGVPKPWRSDILGALQTEGHTVVPFAFRQASADRARVMVYDPNDPQSSVRGERVITFWLDRDSYEYSGLAVADDRRTTVIAADQSSYRAARSAVLASVASMILDCGNTVRRAWRARSVLRLDRQSRATDT